MTAVALVTSSFLPRFGGVEEHVLHVARALRADGHDVVIWAVDQGDPDVPSTVDGITVRYLPCPLPARSPRAALAFLAALPRAFARWSAAQRADRPDVWNIQCFGPNGVWASRLARLWQRKLVVSSHGETYMDADGSFEQSALLRSSLSGALQRAGAVTVCSGYTAADLTARFGLREGAADVVFNGIDAGEAAGPMPSWLPERYVLGVGRLVHTKGFDLLIEAFAAADLPADVRLVIGGDGPERARLEALAVTAGLDGRVIFPGRLARPDVVTVMKQAAVLVVPSRVEAFGITILEGWRAGVPVVATSHGGPPEFMTDRVDGHLIDPLDSEALRAAIEETVAGGAAVEELARAGRQRVATLTWQAAAKSYERVYARVVGQS